MRRRELVIGLTMALPPLAVWGQVPERIRRVAVLTNLTPDDRDGPARISALLKGLENLGWVEGQNLRVDIRWGANDAVHSQRYASELLALSPEVVFAATTANASSLQQVTQTVPIVFAGVSDPVGAGLVASLSRPAGNITGFALGDYAISAKWLELLMELAPGLRRAAVLSQIGAAPGVGQLAAIQSVAPRLNLEVVPLVVTDAASIERAVTTFARTENGGLIVTTGSTLQANRELIVALATRNRMPAVYPFRSYVAAGGLASYGPDLVDLFRRAAGYIDRILRGEHPEHLPVQAPTKYELFINVGAGKALGLTIPPTLLARADEVIE